MKSKEERAAYMREYNRRNRLRVLKQRRDRYSKRKQLICARARERYATDSAYREAKRKRNKVSRERHIEARREQERLYAKTHRETINTKKREYYLKNRERILSERKEPKYRDRENAYRREKYKTSPNVFIKRSRAWRERNPGKCREMHQRQTTEKRQRRVNARLARFGLLFAVSA